MEKVINNSQKTTLFLIEDCNSDQWLSAHEYYLWLRSYYTLERCPLTWLCVQSAEAVR